MVRLTKQLDRLRLLLSGFFSSRAEDSLRLRVLGLVCLELTALALIWVGGNHWLTLGGAAGGALGHWVSWRRRRRRSLVWPLLIGSLVVALSLVMRSQTLEALNGNWLPLGHFLLLVQAIASFDLRTRASLYTGLGINGIILFFASQQAFDPGFGIFLVGYVVLLLAFLALTFLEDGVRDAQVHWTHHRPTTLGYWIGVASAVFALSVLAFWLMPKDEDNLIRQPQLSVLPVTANTLSNASPPMSDSSLSNLSTPLPFPGLVDSDAGQVPGPGSDTPALHGGSSDQIPPGDFLGYPHTGSEDAVLFVRSKVASYWRGQTMDAFDGRSWRTQGISNDLARSADGARIWYNQDSLGQDNPIHYSQTFFVRRDQPNAVFMGYRGLHIIADKDALEGYGSKRGDSYFVLSTLPQFSPEQLRQDHAGAVSPRFTVLPPGSEQWRKLARQISDGASSDFDRAERIVKYLGQHGKFNPSKAGNLTSSTSLDEFLFEAKPGSALDFATATVMLARASGLPARLAVGYLPGVRDPLSAAYRVRQSDAHAWAEIFFARHGWVPFDSAPHTPFAAPGRASGGVLPGARFWLQSDFSEDAYGAVKSAPSRLAGALLEVLGNPIVSILGPLLVLLFLVLRWLYTRSGGRHQKVSPIRLAYSSLPGKGRRELLRVYAQVEKLLRRKGTARRTSWQTVGEYTILAAGGNQDVQGQLSWFAQAAWQAAYNPTELSASLVDEARARLAQLKATMKRRGRSAFSHRS